MLSSPTLSSPSVVRGRHHWQGRCHRGALWLIAFSTTVMHWSGWRAMYLMIFIGAGFYWLLAKAYRREIIRFWRQVRPDASYLDHWLWTYQHLVRYGRVLTDRQLFYHQDFSYSGEGLKPLREALNAGQGIILLSAHMGNWELSAARLNGISRGRAAIVRIIEDDPELRGLIEHYMGDQQPELIDPRDFLAASLRIRSCLAEGKLVCMLGDRQLDGQSAVRAPFLGKTATFSSGPFLVAGLTGAPIFVGFFMKRGRRHYHVAVDPPYTVSLPRKGTQRNAVLALEVGRWAQRLEQAARKHPIQWHNFYNFWG